MSEGQSYYEALILMMFGVNTIIVAALGFLLKKFFNEAKDNQSRTEEIHVNQIRLHEKVKANKDILEQKINMNYKTLSNSVETLGRNIDQQYKNLIEAMGTKNKDSDND